MVTPQYPTKGALRRPRFAPVDVVVALAMVAILYGAGSHTFTREKLGTRYALIGIRMLVDPADANDVGEVHALQDAVQVSQPGGPGRFETPNWAPASQRW